MDSATTLKVTRTNPYPVLNEFRKPEPDTIIVEYSNEMEYLNQYFFIREYIYTRDLHLKTFSGQEDEIDQYSQFVICRKGKFCFGGSRLTISPLGDRKKMPLETEHFRLLDIFPQLDEMHYCELGRTALLPQYRTGEHLDRMFGLAADIAREQGCKLLFGASPPSVARRFRALYNRMGYPTVIHHHIAPPMQQVHEGLGLKFLIMNLAPEEIDVERFAQTAQCVNL